MPAVDGHVTFKEKNGSWAVHSEAGGLKAPFEDGIGLVCHGRGAFRRGGSGSGRPILDDLSWHYAFDISGMERKSELILTSFRSVYTICR